MSEPEIWCLLWNEEKQEKNKNSVRLFDIRNRALENSVRAVISRKIYSCPFFIAFEHDVQKPDGGQRE